MTLPRSPDVNGPPISRVGSLVSLLARNAMFNLLAQFLIIIVGLGCLPYIVQTLTEEKFGLLSLIWGVIGYFTLLDFGISRANSKFLAEAIALEDKTEIYRLVWTSLTLTLLLGVVMGGFIILAAPFIVHQLFNISPALTEQALHGVMLAAVSVPFMLVFGTLKGFQVAMQRFDLVNAFQLSLGLVQWVGSVFLLWKGFGLTEIIYLTVGIRMVLTVVALLNLRYLIPGVYYRISLWHKNTLKKLFSFGGWLTISQIISPMFLYFDRMLIGIFLSLAAISYYTVPQEALTRLLILPMSLTMTLFPALSEQSILNKEVSTGPGMYRRSLKYLMLTMLPVTFLLVTCAQDILGLWMGHDFASKSFDIFQILSVGLFFNAIAQLPTTVLHAYGKPDVTAKYHLIELPVMIGLNLLLIPLIGLMGVAVTWTVRVILDAILLFIGVRKHCPDMGMVLDKSWLSTQSVAHFFLIVGAGIPLAMITSSVVKAFLLVVLLSIYAAIVWRYYFDDTDKHFVVLFRSRIFG